MNDILPIFRIVAGLSNIRRFSTERLFSPESVLEHVGMVGVLSLAIASELNRFHPGAIDLGVLLSRAVVHDIEELETGDIPRYTKHASRKSTQFFDDLSEDALYVLAAKIEPTFPGFSETIRLEHPIAKHGNEGEVLMIADMLAVAYKYWDEVTIRNNLSLLDKVDKLIDQMTVKQAVTKNKFLWAVLEAAIKLTKQAATKERV